MSSFKMKQPRADGKDWKCEFYPYVAQSLYSEQVMRTTLIGMLGMRTALGRRFGRRFRSSSLDAATTISTMPSNATPTISPAMLRIAIRNSYAVRA